MVEARPRRLHSGPNALVRSARSHNTVQCPNRPAQRPSYVTGFPRERRDFFENSVEQEEEEDDYKDEDEVRSEGHFLETRPPPSNDGDTITV